LHSGKSHHKRGASGLNRVAAIEKTDIPHEPGTATYKKKGSLASEEEKLSVIIAILDKDINEFYIEKI
jgi:hypothetical protein